MFRYQVIFSVATPETANNEFGYVSESTMSNVEMVVSAMHPSQARAMVESMYGGPNRCRIKSVAMVY